MCFGCTQMVKGICHAAISDVSKGAPNLDYRRSGASSGCLLDRRRAARSLQDGCVSLPPSLSLRLGHSLAQPPEQIHRTIMSW